MIINHYFISVAGLDAGGERGEHAESHRSPDTRDEHHTTIPQGNYWLLIIDYHEHHTTIPQGNLSPPRYIFLSL